MAKQDTSDDVTRNPYRGIFNDIKASEWPFLPPMKDDQLRKAATTHTSVVSTIDNNQYRYERLVFIGEGVLFSFITLLLQDIYPDINRESASILRGKLLSPPILSAISIHYDIPSMVISSRHVVEINKKSIKATAEMFQSYLGGLFYSYEKEYYSMYDENKIDPVLKEKIHSQGNQPQEYPYEGSQKKNNKRRLEHGSTKPTDVQIQVQAQASAYMQITPFLPQLFQPIAMSIYDPTEISFREILSTSKDAKAELHMVLSQNQLPMPTYSEDPVLPPVDQRKGDQGLRWKVSCKAKGPNGGVTVKEEAIAQNKKDAGNIAAYLVLQKIRVVIARERGRNQETDREGAVSGFHT
ncbi:uncharacterized protein IL334_005863 [Kwoniella shivajii]|uniref:RNase III domain-containing protein n=1 Tax=Kwoniella shivajii TaxID=564305 RepID=A0ABZ1D5L3_9TREE|nr:hypothetical protein IL334_005863 [Kwoniella shivajii]